MNNGETVFIVDSDTESRQRVCDLVHGMQLHPECFSLAQDLLNRCGPDCRGCAILEVRIADLNGLQLQQQLAARSAIPVIFHESHASVPLVVRALQAGAVNFLEKPAEEQELWDAIQQALQIDRERRARATDRDSFQQQLGLLSEKEIQVLELLAQDRTTRTIARELAVSVRTVALRRAHMLTKLKFKTPLQLSRFALRVFDAGAIGTSELFRTLRGISAPAMTPQQDGSARDVGALGHPDSND